MLEEEELKPDRAIADGKILTGNVAKVEKSNSQERSKKEAKKEDKYEVASRPPSAIPKEHH